MQTSAVWRLEFSKQV